jgi:hypothetical protein
MKISTLLLACGCLAGLTQISFGQNTRIIGPIQQKGVAGYLDPKTGVFTARIHPVPAAGKESNSEPTNSSYFFREQFNITINNYDQPTSATVYCSVDMDTFDESTGDWDDSNEIIATRSGNNWTCDVPVLVSWTLGNASEDTIGASVSVDVVNGQINNFEFNAVRSSHPPALTLPVPATGSTVINNVSITL